VHPAGEPVACGEITFSSSRFARTHYRRNIGKSFTKGSPIAFFEHSLPITAAAIDYIAIALILIGAIKFAVRAILIEVRRLTGIGCLQQIRRNRLELGGYILAALEFMIISDIIHTALTRKLEELYFLALLVGVRTAIGFFLNLDLKKIQQEEKINHA